ncbi:hypothetical protein ACHQM5_010699 [Ranunculus cassubicifolius]
MLAALRSRTLPSLSSSSPSLSLPWKLGFHRFISSSSPSYTYEHLNLEEIHQILNDVKADDIKVIPVNNQCDWTDFMVVATGRSTWHVRNIAQALIYKVKQKQKWAERKVLPSVQGDEGGKWVVIDAGKVIVHALDEKAREYYNLEGRWTSEVTKSVPEEVNDLEEDLN